MVAGTHRTGHFRILPRRLQASSGVDEWFLARARSLGVELRHLKVGNRARLFPWVRDRHEFFPVSWRKTHSLSLPGLFRISWPGRDAGIFRMYPALQVLMPLAAEHAALRLRSLPEVEDMVVLEERRIDPILAVRVSGQWYEAYRWWQSPVILPDDCPLIASAAASSKVATSR